jgi:hypothetical protein
VQAQPSGCCWEECSPRRPGAGHAGQCAHRLLVAFLAPRFLTESKPQPGKWDLPGAATATIGLVAIVYGFSHKSQQVNPGSPELNGWTDLVDHGSDRRRRAALAAFYVIEKRSPHALLPLRILADRTRGVSFFVMILVAGSMFSMFYFLGLYIQQVLQYSPIKAGFAFLPFSVAIVAGAGIASALSARSTPAGSLVPEHCWPPVGSGATHSWSPTPPTRLTCCHTSC